MIDPNVTWGWWVLAFIALETLGLISRTNGDTLSERTRVWFRTDTRLGRSVFGISWAVFAIWFLVHILWGWTRRVNRR